MTPETVFPICEFCHFRASVCEHHLTPRSQGGLETVWLCHKCHSKAHTSGTRAFREALETGRSLSEKPL